MWWFTNKDFLGERAEPFEPPHLDRYEEQNCQNNDKPFKMHSTVLTVALAPPLSRRSKCTCHQIASLLGPKLF